MAFRCPDQLAFRSAFSCFASFRGFYVVAGKVVSSSGVAIISLGKRKEGFAQGKLEFSGLLGCFVGGK